MRCSCGKVSSRLSLPCKETLSVCNHTFGGEEQVEEQVEEQGEEQSESGTLCSLFQGPSKENRIPHPLSTTPPPKRCRLARYEIRPKKAWIVIAIR